MVPSPVPIFRFIHIDNLGLLLERGGLHSPNKTPNDGLIYHTIHNEEVQDKRHDTIIPCGPGGTIHDYVPFYFGYLSPMMLNLNTGRVQGYNEGQVPLIYLVSSVQTIEKNGAGFVFSDGHGLATFTDWYDDLKLLENVDWDIVYQRYWSDTLEDMDRQRRKQAEFLVHEFCNWNNIEEIAVINQSMKTRAEDILQKFSTEFNKPVVIKREWYYY